MCLSRKIGYARVEGRQIQMTEEVMLFFQVLRGHEFMLFFDLAQQQIARSQIYSLMAYMPFAFVASHFAFAANGRPKIAYPHTGAERAKELAKSRNLLSSMIADMSPTARTFASPTNLVIHVEL